jgi:hypothetical protein
MNRKYKNLLVAVAIPTSYAIVLRLIFGIKDWNGVFSVMSVTFLFLLPSILGALTVYLSDKELAKRIWYRILAPWLPIILFLFITLAFEIEGWACWLMILPVFLVASSIGGFIGGYLKGRKRNNRLHISLLILIPFLISPLEQVIEKIPGTYKAYTYIDIEADAATIWKHVTRVKTIQQDDDTGYLTEFLGFPRPLKAELNYNGVGAYREAMFTNGLIFRETVTEYEENKKMVFSIKANTYEIPSTTLDEHILIGGKYFDVLNGTYELEKLKEGTYRLHLDSNFKMNTTFNFYAGWWGKLIMKDIQNNILKIEKKRAEEYNL